MPGPEGEQHADEPLEVGEALAPRPVDPRGLVVLVVGVVVAALGPAELVAHRDHRHPVRHRQQAPRVAQLAAAQRHHLVGHAVVALPPAVPRAVVAGAVGAALAVGLVVLAVVGDEVVQREPVVARQEVDAVQRRVEQVGAALHALRAAPAPCPARPRRNPRTSSRKRSFHCSQPRARPRLAELVGADGVPRLGDQPHAPSLRPTRRCWATNGRCRAASDRRQVEAEAVDAEVGEADRATTGSGPAAPDDSVSMSLPHPVVSMYEPSARRGGSSRRRPARGGGTSGPSASTSVVWLNTTSSHTSMSTLVGGGDQVGRARRRRRRPRPVRRWTAPNASGM